MQRREYVGEDDQTSYDWKNGNLLHCSHVFISKSIVPPPIYGTTEENRDHASQ